MKRIPGIIILLCICLSSCMKPDGVERGIENFHQADSECGLCQYLMPENFIEKYDYVEGNYYFDFGVYRIIGGWEKVLLYTQYDADTYIQAKAYAMEHLNLLDDSVVEYNSYYFYQNYNDDCDRYPYDFNQFAYNDEKHTLVFLGFCVSMELYAQVDEVAHDWGAFLEKYYGEWYDFSQ